MSQELREILVFEAGGQRYGLAAADVREVLRAVLPTPLPRAPNVIEGVINLRGTIVPVLDVRRRFKMPLRPVEHTDHFIVAWAGERLVALRADRAIELAHIEPGAVEQAKTVLPGVDYVAQVARFPDGLVLIHDLRTFLSAAEADALTAALIEAAPPIKEGQP